MNPVETAPEEVDEAPPENRFTWSSSEARDDFGLIVQSNVVDGSACTFAGGLARSTGASNVTTVFAVLGEGINAWSVSAGTTTSHLHVAGLVDTREEEGSSRNDEARKTTIEVPNSGGLVTLALFGRGLDPWPNELLNGSSVLVDVACDKPIHLSPLLATREFAMADLQSTTGGAGAHAQPGASVVLMDSLESNAQGDEGFLLWGSLGGAGRVTLDHPGGSEQWIVEQTATRMFHGAPGLYRATLDRVGADLDYFFAVMAGLQSFESSAELSAWTSERELQVS